ncbi:LPXTG cell wall anchor domain-containing protein [Streptomyces sp. NPDC001262]|uniref:LPXTG cell wall anchor domain-containing protein n=1 Tax=Streptomyces TaxID=1883 RepID=UPI00369C9670
MYGSGSVSGGIAAGGGGVATGAVLAQTGAGPAFAVLAGAVVLCLTGLLLYRRGRVKNSRG